MTVFAELLFDKILFKIPQKTNLQICRELPCCPDAWLCKHFRAGTREGASILQLQRLSRAVTLHS